MDYDLNRFRRSIDHGYPTTHDKQIPLHTAPHYTDSRFDHPQTIFGNKPRKGEFGHSHLSYDYSDRLWEWDYEKSEAAVRTANESGHPARSCLWYEAYLSAYFDKPIVIEHIVAGVNVSNGYPYCVFGHREADASHNLPPTKNAG